MANLRFKWLGPSTVTRSKEGSQGTTLQTGHVYASANFPAAVLAEWVLTGNAEYDKDESVLPDTQLEIHSVKIKSHTPKIGAGN